MMNDYGDHLYIWMDAYSRAVHVNGCTLLYMNVQFRVYKLFKEFFLEPKEKTTPYRLDQNTPRDAPQSP